MFLTDSEKTALDTRIAALESRCGVQALAAVVGKSDTYNEAPWKAFALGASLAALAFVAADLARPDWTGGDAGLRAVIAILGVGAAMAGATILSPGFARIFVRGVRRESELHHYAEAMFLRRGMFETRERTAVLLLVGVFERRVVILPDAGLQSVLGPAECDAIIAAMRSHLRGGRAGDSLVAGLDRLEQFLAARGGPARSTRNELPDQAIEERGA